MGGLMDSLRLAEDLVLFCKGPCVKVHQRAHWKGKARCIPGLRPRRELPSSWDPAANPTVMSLLEGRQDNECVNSTAAGSDGLNSDSAPSLPSLSSGQVA